MRVFEHGGASWRREREVEESRKRLTLRESEDERVGESRGHLKTSTAFVRCV